MQATPTPNAPALTNAFSADHKLIAQGYETLIALVVGFIAWRLCFALIDRFFAQRLLLRHPRVKTYLSPIKSIVSVVFFVAVGLVLLHIWNVDIGPAVWSAGAITAVLAFGAQWVVRDLLAGYSIFAENQLEVGDRVELTTGINSQVSGIVEAIGLRTTRLIDRHGRTVFIPNGNIYVATNLSRGVKRLEVNVDVPWRGSVESMKREITAIAKDAARVAKVDEQGVTVTLDEFSQESASFRISIRAPEAHIDTDEGTVRERIAAALQSKGWLPSGDQATPADGSAPKS
ncbi:MAG: mechanosensitive ion channel family protein [Candidatus Eremiobacteraeota bacterium]|nr:mechanosensitive ion channel family protein [Candidatus Eremiobacteraeota bacterium]